MNVVIFLPSAGLDAVLSAAIRPPAGLPSAVSEAAAPAAQADSLMFAVTVVAALLVGGLVGAYVGRLRAATSADARGHELQTELASIRATLDAERGSAEQRLADLRGEHERLSERFRAVSAEVVRDGTSQLLDMATQRFARQHEASSADLAARQQAVDAVVSPLREALAKVEQQLAEVERNRVGAYSELRQQVAAMGQSSESLRGETARLVTALRAPHVRGHWGEMQLRRTVELAGMVEHCDFVEQEQRAGSEGALRPDLVVRLAGGKQILVDSKAPMTAWLEANEADDEPRRHERRRAHARHFRAHVDQLAAKSYWERFGPTPEFVVMFVPADVILDAALQEDPALLEHAFGRNVVVATPSTLVTLLRTIGYTWRQEALTRNAQQVLTIGRELHARLATMGGHVTKLGNALGSAVDHFNKTVSSLESRVMVTARQLGELHLTDKDLPEIQQVERQPRQVQAFDPHAFGSDTVIALETVGRSRTGT